MMQGKPEKEHIHNHMMVTIKQPQNKSNYFQLRSKTSGISSQELYEKK